MRHHLHVWVRADPFQKRALNCGTGLILVVNDARQGMACLAGQVKLAGIFCGGIERNAKLVDQHLFYQTWAFMAQQAGRFGRTQAAADREDVGH